jgi:hypothetical protein
MKRTPQFPASSQYRGAPPRRTILGMRTGIVGLATTLLLCGGPLLAAPSAQANPCPPYASCQTWCPGQPRPAGRPVPWDPNVCHNFYWDNVGVHDTDNGILYKWSDMGW